MEILYAPWRTNYIKPTDAPRGCPFCTLQAATSDDELFIIARGEHNIVLLNLYPYTAGHLLIVPYAHGGDFSAQTDTTSAEQMQLLVKAQTILRTALGAQGINMGINLGGKAAGGSIPEHLHWHVIPRWQGDTSFLPLISNTKPVSIDLIQTYEKIKAAWHA
jgi:ATP adenylyltransferase